MASLESLQTREVAAETRTQRVVDDKSLALGIVYKPQATGTTPVVTISTGVGITLADSLTTTGSLAFTTYSDLGLLADKINSYARWECRILDGLRATKTETNVMLPDSGVTAATINGESIFRVYLDGSINDEMYYRVSMYRGVTTDDKGRTLDQSPIGSHRVKLTGIKYRINFTAAETNNIRIYESNPATATDTQIWNGQTGTDDTATAEDFSLFPFTAAEGSDLVVMFKDTEIADTLTNYIEVNYIRE